MPSEGLEEQGYPDLTGRIEFEDSGRFPVHTGGRTDVYTGHLTSDPTTKVAIKFLRFKDNGENTLKIRRRLIQDASVWYGLRHKNVLRFLGLADGLGRLGGCPALIVPYCHNGTVGDYVRRLNLPVDARVLLNLGIARGLEYLHGKGIIHGELHPSNVLMSDRDEPLLCDFGRSLIVDVDGLAGTSLLTTGTIRYQARELLEDNVTPNETTDVCALGLTAFEIWTGVPPFSEIRNDAALYRHILFREAQLQLPRPPPPMADRLWPILSSCFSHTPENRPTIQQVTQRLEYCTQPSPLKVVDHDHNNGNPPVETSAELGPQCHVLMMEVATGVAQQRLSVEPGNTDAQPVIDYLSRELLDDRTMSLSPKERKSILKFLFELVKSSEVFPKSFELELERIQCQLIYPVTEGAFGLIYRGLHDGQQACVKTVRVFEQDVHYKQRLRAQAGEVVIWAHLAHKNILPFLGLYASDERVRRICIVSPWMENGDLLQYLEGHPEAPRILLLHDTICGLKYLHELDIVHADLKAKNILVSGTNRARIADFGLSRVSMTLISKSAICGTPHWMAPELLLENESVPKKESDIWAFGCTCYEVLSGRKPFYQFKPQQLIKAFIQGHVIPCEPNLQSGPRLDEKVKVWPLVVRCWEQVPGCRPGSEVLLKSFAELNVLDDRLPDDDNRSIKNARVDIDHNRVYGALERIRGSNACK